MNVIRLRALRIEQGLRQDELASRAGIGQAVISGFETGRINPRPNELARLARALGVPGETARGLLETVALGEVDVRPEAVGAGRQ